MNVTAHVAQNTARRRSAIDGRTTRHAGYGVSQRIRMRGRERVDMAFAFSAAACNLIRLPGLLAEPKVA